MWEYQPPGTPKWTTENLFLTAYARALFTLISQIFEETNSLAKWLKTPVFEIVLNEQSWVQILSRTYVLPKPQMI